LDSDITYLGSAEGWLYLCAVRDGCSRRVIGWALDQYLHTDLIQAAMDHNRSRVASCGRKPQWSSAVAWSRVRDSPQTRF
jgi:transposase InsO family protein